MTALDVAAHLALHDRHPAVTRAHLDAEHRNAVLALGFKPMDALYPVGLHQLLHAPDSFPEEVPA